MTPHSAHPVLDRLVRFVQQELRDVEADAAGAQDGDPVADGGAVPEHVLVGDDARVIDARDVGDPRDHAGRQHDLVEVRQVTRRRGGAEP